MDPALSFSTGSPPALRPGPQAKKVAQHLKKHRVTGIDYTNEDNPFGDANLTERFVWGKKIEKELVSGRDVRDMTAKAEARRQAERLVSGAGRAACRRGLPAPAAAVGTALLRCLPVGAARPAAVLQGLSGTAGSLWCQTRGGSLAQGQDAARLLPPCRLSQTLGMHARAHMGRPAPCCV